MVDLEQLQKYAEAKETCEHYEKTYQFRALILFGRAIGSFCSGFLFAAGFVSLIKLLVWAKQLPQM